MRVAVNSSMATQCLILGPSPDFEALLESLGVSCADAETCLPNLYSWCRRLYSALYAPRIFGQLC